MIRTIIGGAVGAFALFLALDVALMTPDVMVSYSTKDCVEVVNYGSVIFGETNYSCENMPSRYNQVWAK
jgi:hypothetical protein